MVFHLDILSNHSFKYGPKTSLISTFAAMHYGVHILRYHLPDLITIALATGNANFTHEEFTLPIESCHFSSTFNKLGRAAHYRRGNSPTLNVAFVPLLPYTDAQRGSCSKWKYRRSRHVRPFLPNVVQEDNIHTRLFP